MASNSESKNRRNNFLVQGSILAVASIISRIVGLIYRLPLTAIIGKVGNDYYGTAYQIYNIILLLSSYSIPLAVSKLVATRMAQGQAKNAYKVLKGSILFAIISGGSAAVIVFVFAKQFTEFLATPLAYIALRVLAPVIFMVAIVGVLRGFFQGLHSMLPTAVSQILEQIVNAIVSVAAAYFLFSYGARVGAEYGDSDRYAAAWGAAGGTLGTALGSASALIFLIFLFTVYRKRFKRKMARDVSNTEDSYKSILWLLLITIIPVLLSTTLYNVSGIVDQTIFKKLANYDGYSSNQISLWWGVYSGQYNVIINVPISIASAMASSSVPSLTTAYKSNDQIKVRSEIHSATRFIMTIAFPCAVGIFVLAQPIQLLLFGDSDPTSGYMLMVGAVSVVFYSLSTLSNGLLQGIDKLNLPVIHAAISLGLQAVVLVLCMQVFDLNIYSVIIATSFYALCMCVLNNIALVKHSGVKYDIRKTFIIPAIGSLIMGVAVWLVYFIFGKLLGSNAIGTILSVLAGMAVYFVAMLLLKGFTREELLRVPKGHVLVRIAEKMHLL